jgi:hypothetical protein
MTVTMAYDATKLKVFGSHATLADLLTPRLVANPFSAMHMDHSLGCGVGRGGAVSAASAKQLQQLGDDAAMRGALSRVRRCAAERRSSSPSKKT